MKNMKKSLIILITILLLLSCVSNGNIIESDEQFRIESFSLFDGSEKLMQKVDIIYNEINKPVEVVTSDADGEIFNRKTMTYTDTGKIEFQINFVNESSYVKTEYTYNGTDFLVQVLTTNENGTVLGTNSYLNDERGNPVQWVAEYNGGNDRTHFLMDYDDADRITKTTELDRNENAIYYSVSEYNELGSELSYTIFSPEGIIDQQQLNYYQSDQLIRTEVRDESGNILFHTDQTLDESGKPVKISSFNQYEDLTDWIDIEYSDEGLEVSRKSFDFEGNLVEKIVKEYDEQGNLTSVIFYDDNEDIISITRNRYYNAPLNMSEVEFNALVFRL